jgi:phage shock protein A
MKEKVLSEEATALAKTEIAGDDLHDRLLELGKQDEVEQMLQAIKAKKIATHNSLDLLP